MKVKITRNFKWKWVLIPGKTALEKQGTESAPHFSAIHTVLLSSQWAHVYKAALYGEIKITEHITFLPSSRKKIHPHAKVP